MIIHVRDEDTGKIIPIDTDNLSGTIGFMDVDTGIITQIDLSNLPSTMKVIDADTGKIKVISGTDSFSVVDADTGKIVTINPSNSIGSLSIVDDDTGKITSIDLSTTLLIKTVGLDYIKSNTIIASFPTTPILDNFNRGNGGPPPSANWGSFDSSWGILGQLTIVGGQAYSPIDEGGNYWSANSFGPNCEVYCNVMDVGSPDVSTQTVLYLRILGENSDRSTDGSFYSLLVNTNYNNPGDTIYNIMRADGSNTTILSGGVDVFTLSSGDGIGLRRNGNTLTVYHKPVGGSWTLFDTVEDNSPLSSVVGKIALISSTYVDNFGGGNI